MAPQEAGNVKDPMEYHFSVRVHSSFHGALPH